MYIALANKQSPLFYNEKAGSVTIVELCGLPFNDGRGRAEGLGLEVWFLYHLQHEAGGLPAHLVHVRLDGGAGFFIVGHVSRCLDGQPFFLQCGQKPRQTQGRDLILLLVAHQKQDGSPYPADSWPRSAGRLMADVHPRELGEEIRLDNYMMRRRIFLDVLHVYVSSTTQPNGRSELSLSVAKMVSPRKLSGIFSLLPLKLQHIMILLP